MTLVGRHIRTSHFCLPLISQFWLIWDFPVLADSRGITWGILMKNAFPHCLELPRPVSRRLCVTWIGFPSHRAGPPCLPLRSLLAPSLTDQSRDAPGTRVTLHAVCRPPSSSVSLDCKILLLAVGVIPVSGRWESRRETVPDRFGERRVAVPSSRLSVLLFMLNAFLWMFFCFASTHCFS